jgi:hypothetical protein
VGTAASDPRELVKRVERLLDFRACPLIIGRDRCDLTFAIDVACFLIVACSGKHFSEVIVGGNVTGIPSYHFSELKRRIVFSAFLLKLERQRIARERIVGIHGDKFFKRFFPGLHVFCRWRTHKDKMRSALSLSLEGALI